jgi:hypothetical protein
LSIKTPDTIRAERNLTKHNSFIFPHPRSTFQKKFCNILRNEGLKPFTSEEIGITHDTAYDYRSGRSGPSAKNLAKIIKAFPQYTCYILISDEV